ncbi:unnamed protein product [Euphydryas editha]|uniref:tRNA (guanosine(18)-2'-O)-methyltransferase TARBP1 n=1 Tax=Euphydryas editha TaxID=104508 RepID=A0AAU9VEC5_EUPED|nr:unnamed protein product [Euphydryas editha]
MQSEKEILSFLDLLDLDEEIIDERAKNIMEKKNFTNKHLSNYINLLQYKQLINKRENSECENEEEYNFVVKLISNMNQDNVDYICRIIQLVLLLHPSSIVSKSEHFIQQILFDVYLPSPRETLVDTEIQKLTSTLLQLKIINSILTAVTLSSNRLSLLFVDIPLECIIFSKDEKLQAYFLTHTVPQLFDAVTGYNILDRIWNVLKENKENAGETALQVLCCLSNYYLPVVESGSVAIESEVISHTEFWEFVIFGMLNKDYDNTLRKKSIYLAKRAVDCVVNSNKNIEIMSGSICFFWDIDHKKILKKTWDNYFILLDSLEEKQGNIVLPSLKLFDSIIGLGCCWMNCAFLIGLYHDNAQVRYQCLKYRLQIGISSEFEAAMVLEAINDINIFENSFECQNLRNKLKYVMMDLGSLMNILKCAPSIKWSPVPLFHLTTTLSDIDVEKLLVNINPLVMMDLVCDMLKIPCNNIVIRKAIQVNISHFVGRNCKKLPWKEYMNLYFHLQLDVQRNCYNPCNEFIKENLVVPDLQEFLKFLPSSHNNIDFALLYFEGHDDSDFIIFLNNMVNNIQNINSRQYSNKNECLDEAIFIVQLYKRVIQNRRGIFDKLNTSVATALQTILEYVSSLLTNDINFDIEKIILLFDGLDYMNSNLSPHDNQYLVQLYKSAILLLNGNDTDLEKRVLSMFVCNTCLKAPVLLRCYRTEILDLHTFINIMKTIKFNEIINKGNSGRLRNAFYEKSCEIVFLLTRYFQGIVKNDIVTYVYNILDCGGYGCLKWILRIINKIFPSIIKNENIVFDVTDFLNLVWKEIEELKSNSQYNVCIQEFVVLITQDSLLKLPEYYNMVISYTKKILDYAAIKSTPLYYLVKRMNEINISLYSHMTYVLCDILLYTFIPRKDHRIAEILSCDILGSRKYSIKHEGSYFNCNIKVLAVSILSKILDPVILNTLTELMIEKLEELFQNKKRYYANSLHERTLEAAIQNLLFIFFKCRKINLDSILMWVMDFLGKIPHQPYIRTYFEWYIALNYYYKGDVINEKMISEFKENNLPLQSQFTILYWITTHKIKLKICQQEEFEYVMDFLLSNIMGPTYSTRMYAQYFSSRIYEANTLTSTNPLDSDKYAYTFNIINKSLDEALQLKDKSFVKLTKDYYIHIFDIVEDLTPFAIYWGLPQLCEGFNDTIDTEFLEKYLEVINESVVGEPDKFFDEWINGHKDKWNTMRINLPPQSKRDSCEFLEESGTIQKKYVPWKNMSDIDVYNIEKRKDKSNLILVASLIDKLPNLGGMARTSEVFGVQTYVVDSLRHLQDKQFQGLSVSAERWINVEEVRPGQALREYLLNKKTEGYTVVAAEQTSNSTMIQKFKFPKKTLLLLGHEKEGIPCDLLPLMDNCVEVPQQGVIRSLNVHVTAAIFIWEYARQNIL